MTSGDFLRHRATFLKSRSPKPKTGSLSLIRALQISRTMDTPSVTHRLYRAAFSTRSLWHRRIFRCCRRWRGNAGDEEGGRREYGEPRKRTQRWPARGGVCTVVPGPRMLQQRGCSAPAPATTTSSASSSSSSASSFTNTTMFPQQYCLRWKYHHSNLQTMFSQLLERQAYCDVTLACEGKTLRAHKVNRAERCDGVMTYRRWRAFRKRASKSRNTCLFRSGSIERSDFDLTRTIVSIKKKIN